MRLRFSIRTLLVLALIVAVGITVYRRQTRIRTAIAKFEELGGTVQFEDSLFSPIHALTDHFFAAPVALDLSHSRIRRGDLDGIGELSSLQRLYLDRTSIGSEDVAELVNCPELKRLSLWGNYSLSSSVIGDLVKLKNLEVLDISQTRILPGKLGKLASLPRLQHLIYPSEYYNDEHARMSGNVMRELAKIPHRTPVGDCFLWDFDEEELQLFFTTDTSRIDELLFRDCGFDEAACKALSGVTARTLDLQSCTIDDDRLKLIDHRNFERIDIFNSRDPSLPRISLAGLSAWIPPDLRGASIQEGHVEFDYQSSHFWKFRIMNVTDSINANLVQRWLDLGMEELHLSDEGALASQLKLVAKMNPSIHLKLHNHPFVWQYIEQMSDLKGLTIYNSVETPLRFPTNSSLSFLEVYGQTTPSRADLAEISKLRNLRWLQIRNRSSVGLEAAYELERLRDLTFVSFARIDADAKKYLQDLCLRNKRRHVSWDDIKTAKQRGL